MENIAYHNTTYNITPICLDSSECSSMEALSLGCKTHLDKGDAKRNLMDTGIYTPDSNSDSPDPRSDSSCIEVSNSLSVSHPISFCNWTNEEISLLTKQINIDLTSDALCSAFPNKPLASIIRKIHDLQPVLEWTKNEIYLLAGIILNDSNSVIRHHKHKFPCRNVSNLNKKFQHYKNMVRKLNRVDSSKWTKPEIASLISLKDYDLTKTTLQKELPNKSIDEIKDLTNEMRIHSNFSLVESVLFEQAMTDNNPIEIVLGQFPLKNKETCKARLLKLNELPQHRDMVKRRLDELESLIQNELEQVKDSIDLTRLKYLLTNDLTGKQLKSLFPGIPTKYLKIIAKEIGFDEAGEYTPAEVNFLKNALQENAKLKSIIDELPFRSQLSIETTINSIEPNRRRSVFTGQVDELLYMAQWYSSDNFGNLSRRRNSRYASKLDKPKNKTNDAKKPGTLYLEKEEVMKAKVVPHDRGIEKLPSDCKMRDRHLDQEVLKSKNNEQKTRKSRKPMSMIEVLKEESAYFQSVTGNRCVIKEGQKRKRERPMQIKSETKPKKSKSQSPNETNSIQETNKLMKHDVKPEKVKQKPSKSVEEKVVPHDRGIEKLPSECKVRDRHLDQEVLKSKNNEQETRKSRKPMSMIEVLKEESAYFQSVTGNRCVIKEGQKRKRERPMQIKSETKPKKSKGQSPNETNSIQETNKLMKHDVKPEKVKQKPSKLVKVKETKIDAPDSPIVSNIEISLKKKLNKIVNEERRSRYDPEDISTDTLVPLNGRQLYVDEVYGSQPCPPKLSFREDTNMMVQNCCEISLTDTIAADIVSQHCKNYRDMPISFPLLTIVDRNTNTMILNPMNKIRIRFLLYPQHSELFILAEPKSNELDPINEIKKLFQLHYSLFFSHSSKLKKIILNEYNKEIDISIEENDFVRFMFVIDKWNRLMVELTPNDVDIGSHDINEEIRSYFLHNEIKIPSDEDIRLDIFLSEIQQSTEENPISDNDPIEPSSPSFDLIKSMGRCFTHDSPSGRTPPIFSEEDNKENEPPIDKALRNNHNKGPIPCSPIRLNTRNKMVVNAVKPENYELNFFRHLKEKTSVSRFCVQQILLRIYSRIVSTESRKLRSYKAFTAEVYGELLPSFTSEVLTKVDLQPQQKFYDLGSGVGNTTFQAALEFGVHLSGGCEIMEHASKLTELQTMLLNKHLALFGLKKLPLNFALLQSFVDNDIVRQAVIECDVLLVNNYLFDVNLNTAVGKMLYGLKPGTKIISLRNFIRPRYKATSDNTIFDYLKVERHEMSNYLSVSWTANKVPYYISTVQENICDEYV